jgi:hypothetical protein
MWANPVRFFVVKDTPDALRCDKCTWTGCFSFFGVLGLLHWLWLTRAETVNLKLGGT